MVKFKSALLIIAVSLPAWSMVHFKDADNHPWNRTTNDGPDKEVKGFYINLGITGARAKVTETNKRALEIMYIFAGTPAAGKLQVGDLVVGAEGKAFTTDLKNGYGMDKFGGDGPYMDFGNALESSQGSDGKLNLDVKRAGKDVKVTLDIGTKYGKYNSTFPYEDTKTDLILGELYEFIASKQETNGSWKAGHVTFMAGMALLSSGDKKYLPHVKKAAEWFGQRTQASIEKEMFGLHGWKYSLGGVLLSEYYLVTEEQWVKKELEEIRDWLLAAQFIDMSQHAKDTHGPANEKQLGGWGHNPHYEGYGPFHAMTGQAMIALALMTRVGIEVDEKRLDLGYKAMSFGIGENGYVWYSHGVGGGPTKYADMGRTGTLAVAHMLSPSRDDKHMARAAHHAKCIGYDDRFKSFPDTHGSPHIGMVWTALGAVIDEQGYRNLMDYHRWWFSLTQAHDGNQFVDQPNRDAGGSYDNNTRVASSAVAALVLSAKNKTLHVGGYTKPVTGIKSLPRNLSKAQLMSFGAGQLEFFLPKGGGYEITVSDLLGNTRNLSGEGRQGRNILDLGFDPTSQGVYYIRLRSGNTTSSASYSMINM